ncbi:HNH endonuclease [Streptomyces hydrogenans]|uniref:HNH endonuclease n=1 Tax=Streptomyces hydrogenans TaxID=1873719 RepID=UPI0035D905C9
MPPPRRSDLPEPLTRAAVLRRWEELDWWSCAYCDSPFGQTVVAEVDHIRPLAKGGQHVWENLAPACRDCNHGKADGDVGTWIDELSGQEHTERIHPAT